jgi:hypothetical protein
MTAQATRVRYLVTDAEGRKVEGFEDLFAARDAAESRARLYDRTYRVVSANYPEIVLATCKP